MTKKKIQRIKMEKEFRKKIIAGCVVFTMLYAVGCTKTTKTVQNIPAVEIENQHEKQQTNLISVSINDITGFNQASQIQEIKIQGAFHYRSHPSSQTIHQTENLYVVSLPIESSSNGLVSSNEKAKVFDTVLAISKSTNKVLWQKPLIDFIPDEVLSEEKKNEIKQSQEAFINLISGIETKYNECFTLISISYWDSETYFEEQYLIGFVDATGETSMCTTLPKDIKSNNIVLLQIIGDDLYLSNEEPSSNGRGSLLRFHFPTQMFTSLGDIALTDISFPEESKSKTISKNTEINFVSRNEQTLVGGMILQDASLQWSKNANELGLDMPTTLKTIVGYSKQIVVFTDHFVIGLDADSKNVSWKMHLIDLPPYSIHGIVQQENKVYFALGPQDWNRGASYLVAFDIVSHEFLWKWKFPTSINEGNRVFNSEELSAPSVYIKNGPIIFDGKLIFICNNGCMYQITI
jgi:hypothetical protein